MRFIALLSSLLLFLTACGGTQIDDEIVESLVVEGGVEITLVDGNDSTADPVFTFDFSSEDSRAEARQWMVESMIAAEVVPSTPEEFADWFTSLDVQARAYVSAYVAYQGLWLQGDGTISTEEGATACFETNYTQEMCASTSNKSRDAKVEAFLSDLTENVLR